MPLTMYIPRASVIPFLKKNGALAVPSWLPKRGHRLLNIVQAKLWKCRCNASRWLLLTVLMFIALSAVLVRDTFSKSNIIRVVASNHINRSEIISSDEFTVNAIVQKSPKNKNATRPLDSQVIHKSIQHWAQMRDIVLPGSDWDSIADDVAIAIKTGHEVAAERLGTLRKSGWLSVGRRVPNLLVVSDLDDDVQGVVGVKRYAIDVVTGRQSKANRTRIPRLWFNHAGWRGDKDKNLPALHLLATTFPGKKWYMLLDDDTYIFLDNFARYVQKHAKSEKAVYTGKAFAIANCGGFTSNGRPKNNAHGKQGLFAHGGAGIFMNKKAMDAMFPHIPNCIAEFSGCWAGDMQVGLCMYKVGVRLLHHIKGYSHKYLFTPFGPSRAMADSRYTKRLSSSFEPVSFHKIHEMELKLISKFERRCAIRGNAVNFKALRAFLQENDIKPTFGKGKTIWDTNVFVRK